MSIAPAAARPHLTEEPARAGGSVRASSGRAGTDDAVRRVRHQARDAATVMAFSAATSLAVATAFLLLAVLARQA